MDRLTKSSWLFLPCIVFWLVAATAVGQDSAASQTLNISTVLMESTFRIEGVAKSNPNMIAMGTVFFLGRPKKSDPSRSSYVLVTARHVLDDIAGDDATILLRSKTSNGDFQKYPYKFKIRDHGRDLYFHHAEADVAVMYFMMPIEDPFTLIDESGVADDKTFQKYEIHPGDELMCLGFPLGAAANDSGFPILRSGKIASYPLIPAATVKSLLFDFRVFPGNSGGPVYFDYPTKFIGGALRAGSMMGIAGLVTKQEFSPYVQNIPIEIGVVVPAQFISETINLLPDR